mgnify:CR=1 FL=1
MINKIESKYLQKLSKLIQYIYNIEILQILSNKISINKALK